MSSIPTSFIRPGTRQIAWRNFLPFLLWRKRITAKSLWADFLAGLTGAVIVLPQGVAFAMIAGLPPQYGLYTAIVIPIIAALFGSSHHLVSGPTTAISAVMFSVVSQFAVSGTAEYLDYVLTLTFMAGLFQLFLGLARMGSLVNFVSHTVVIGFTMGAAVLIATAQLEHAFGVSIQGGESFLGTVIGFVQQLPAANPYVILVALVTLVTTVAVRHYRPRFPFMLIGIVVGSLTCVLIDGEAHGVPLVGSLPGQLPPLSSPTFSLDMFRQLAQGALAIGLLGLIEAVSIARAIATRSQQRIDANQEFIGQGLSNVMGSFFSCYAGSGSFTRSGVNYEAGAKTPLSAIFASLIVAVVLVLMGSLTAYLPMPTMAGVILLVAWNLIDIPHLRRILRTSRRETAVLFVTFFATLLIALEFAVYVGVLVSLFMYLQRTSHPKIISLAPDAKQPRRRLSDASVHELPECPQIKILRLDGSLFFGAVDHVQEKLHWIAEQGSEWKHVLIIGSGINFIDVAGAQMLAQEARRFRRRGGGLYLCRLKDTVKGVLERGGYIKAIGRENLFSNKEEAIRLIFQHLDEERCSLCTRRIFRECATVKFEGKGVLS